MTTAERNAKFKKRYAEEVERSIDYYNRLNQEQPVHTYYITQEEMIAMTTPREDCHRLTLGGTYRI